MHARAKQPGIEPADKSLSDGILALAASAGIPPAEFALHFRKNLSATPDRERALRNYDRFLRAGFTTSAIRDFHAHPVLEEILLQLAAQSQYLADILVRSPELLHWLTASGALTRTISREEYLREANHTVGMFERRDKRLNALKRLHRREMLRIGAREVLGEAPGQVVAGELAALADAIVQAALHIARDELRVESGTIPDPLLAVIGLGKLGGGELNFSSDIDLMFVYDRDADLDVPIGGIHTMHQLCVRIVESTLRTLTEHTGEGYLYRVDLRLRPDGQAGPIAMARDAYMTYYESRGELWERQMLIKARVIAGESSVGERLLRDLRPFIFPRTHLRSPLEEIASIKRRIEEKVAGTENIKLGAGGIRDIEFIVQGLQLLNGGKAERIREGRTLTALGRLEDASFLKPAEAKQLREAYLFLRSVEHRLQLLEGRQTHSLPETTQEVATLARRLAYLKPGDFRRKLDRHREVVRRLFIRTTGAGASTRAAGVAPRSADPVRALLASLNLKTGPELRSTVVALQESLPALVHGELHEGFVRRFRSAGGTADTLVRFVGMVRAESIRRTISAATANERLLDLLLRVCHRSRHLARVLTTEPLLFESLAGRPGEMLGADPAWDFLRSSDPARFRLYNDARVILRFLSGATSIAQTVAEFSATAEIIVTDALREAQRELESERLPVLIALGKLGGSELTLGSDLDLVFLSFEEGREERARDDRIAKNFLAAVSSRVPPVYKVDLRLRPEGRSAPMVTSGTFFREYFRGRAQLWERQSLLRARVLAGLPEDRSAAESLIAEALTGESLPDGWVNEMRAMRKRIERERTKAPRGSTDLKTGPGGLLDIEFAVQALQLDAGMHRGMERIPGTVAAVRRLTSDGNLKKGIGRLLEMNYLWLRQLELYMRMNATEGGGSWPCGKDLSGIIATAMGEKGAVALDRRLRSILGANRSLMETILDDLMKVKA